MTDEPTLDPSDWDDFRSQAHAMVDAAIDHMRVTAEGRVWTPLPQDQKQALAADLPVGPQGHAQIKSDLTGLLPYGVGNTHPRFFGWVHGAGSPGGLLPDIAAAAMNANLGGRDHGGIYVERQVLDWCKDIMGFPASASGLLVSGTSMATIIALKVARDRQGGGRLDGLVGYASAQAHSCIERAFDLLGLGKAALRKVPCNDAFEMDVTALRAMIVQDRAAGLRPFLIAGTAGAVNVGAIDDLAGLADLAAAEGLWLHVDGAFGAAGMMSPEVRPLLAGLARADSLAFDFHKWFHVNYDAGCVLVRDAAAHRAAFAERPAYLAQGTRGLAAGEFWPVDYGPELSRGFRALKVWAHLREHGTEKLGAAVARNCAQARYLGALVDDTPLLERLAPVALNIVCFRYTPESHPDLNALNQEIVVQLQEQGIAVPSTTLLNGALAIRVNLTNHRTRTSDLDLLVKEVLRIGAEFA